MLKTAVRNVLVFAMAGACGGSSGNGQAAGDAGTVAHDAGGPADAGALDAGIADGDTDGGAGDTGIAAPQPPQLPECLQGEEPPGCAELPRFSDWACPEGWVPTPAFTDENGVENPPEGVAQFNICYPPENWNPVKLESWVCPAGWNAVPGFTDENGAENPPEGMGQFTVCMPPEVPECPDGEVAYLGETACHAIGSACPAGDFHDEGTTKGLAPGFSGKVVYVKAGAAGGDGSAGAPYGAVGEGLATAAAGDVVALSPGTYTEAVSIDKAIALIGACAGGTIVKAPDASEMAGTVELTGAGGGLVSNLRVTGERTGVWVKGAAVKAALKGVEVKGAAGAGIVVSDGAAGADVVNVVVRDTMSQAQKLGRGVAVRGGAAVTLANAVVERNREYGVVVSGTGTAVSIAAAVVRATKGQELDRQYGWGVFVFGGAALTGGELLVEGNHGTGLIIRSALTTADVADVVVRDTAGQESDGSNGRGIQVKDGASVAVTRAVLERNRDIAVAVYGTPAPEARLTDVLVRDTKPEAATGYFGRGIEINQGAAATVIRAVLDRNRETGVLVSGDEGGQFSTLDLSDSVIRDTRGQEADQSSGVGLAVQNSATVTLARAAFERNRQASIFASGAGVTLTIDKALVRDTQGEELSGTLGQGLHAIDGARVDVTRTVFEGNHDHGIFARDGTAVSVRDSVVRDTMCEPYSGSYGNGIEVNGGAVGTVTRTVFERNRYSAVLASEAGSSLDLSDVAVLDTMADDANGVEGKGAEYQNAARGTIARTVFSRNTNAGLLVTAGGSSVDVSDVVIRDTLAEPGTGAGGWGMGVQYETAVVLARALLTGNREAGIFVTDSGAVLDAGDVTIRDTRAQDNSGEFGTGLTIQKNAEGTVARLVVERCRSSGVFVGSEPGEAPAVVDLEDVLVRDIAEQASDGDFGRGISLQGSAHAVVRRALISRCTEVGFLASGIPAIFPFDADMDVEVSDIVIRDTKSNARDGWGGRGLSAQHDVAVGVSRALLERNREQAVLAINVDDGGTVKPPKLRLSDVVLRDTLMADCAFIPENDEKSCIVGDVAGGGGAGLSAAGGAEVTMESFEIDGGAQCGIQVARGASIAAANGNIHDNAIGVNVQVDGYDLTTILSPTVRVYDNDTNFDTKELPVPDPVREIDGMEGGGQGGP
ncbi:MAG: right-handed parallel beta-helix repeat-containing protein [Deltaproteobacteria bacterium]|nr:right-handed parallel beta-helix repeat-containing protein [Deltaproteobacteria bacterium]